MLMFFSSIFCFNIIRALAKFDFEVPGEVPSISLISLWV